MNFGRLGRIFGRLGASVKSPSGGGPPPSTAGEMVGFPFPITKAS